MAKAKLTLSLSPTFKSKVAIPVPGSKPVEVEFTFKGRSKSEFKELWEKMAGGQFSEDTDAIMEIASGWELEEPFDLENVLLLTETYMGAAKAIINKYLEEVPGIRLGN